MDDFRTHVRDALNRADGIRVAKGPPPPPQQGKNGGNGFPGQQGMEGGPGGMTPPGTQPSNRQIPSNHKFDTKALKPLAKMLWAMSVSLGHALQAYRIFNRVKSSTVSPDGMVGGRGYIMKVTELRQQLYDACEALSAVSDTIHDEINAPHWKPKIGELSSEDFEAIERLIGESEHLLENPEEDIEDEEAEVEKKGKPSSSWVKKMKNKKDDAKPGSDLPDGGDQETVPAPKSPMKMKQASVYDRREQVEATWREAFSHGGWAIDEDAARIARILSKVGDSSVNPDSLPGPRVKHLDRGDSDQTGPMGTVNPDEPVPPKDDWGKDEGVSGEPMSQDYGNQPAYQWDGGRNAMPQMPVAVSAFPDSNLDKTPTEGFDFGIGRGNGDDAHGQGAKGQSQTYSPGMADKGVYGPASDLPNDPGGKTHDRENSDSGSSAIDEALNNSHKAARARLRQLKAIFVGPDQQGPDSKLPGDNDKDVARSDYYTGPKDNDIDTIKGPTENPVLAESELPNSSPHSKPAPLIPRPFSWNSFEFATSQVPGDGGSAHQEFDKGLLDTSYRYEQMDEPYVKWDDSTHNQRVDDNTMRDPMQGPYVRN